MIAASYILKIRIFRSLSLLFFVDSAYLSVLLHLLSPTLLLHGHLNLSTISSNGSFKQCINYHGHGRLNNRPPVFTERAQANRGGTGVSKWGLNARSSKWGRSGWAPDRA
ncbi:hypothetical protein V8C34DRAFT_188346 [Trichoderma compactum]